MQVNFKPTARQLTAYKLLTDNTTNEVLYGGGARGGKSYFGCAWILIECFSKPGSQWMIGRYELKRLRATTLLTMFEVLTDFGIDKKAYNYNSQESTITFVNGSRIFLVDLSHQPSDPLYDRLGSYGLTGDFIDEAQEVNFQAINVLKGRYSVLEGKGWKTIPKSLRTCNPSLGWIKTEFYTPYVKGTLDKRRAFVPSLVTDNPYISQDYIDQLKTADKVTVERLLKGNFDYDDTPGKLYEYDKLVDMFTNPIQNGIKYISCDVARFGRDKAIILVWNGFEVIDFKVFDNCTIQELENQIILMTQKHHIGRSNVIVDEDGVGGGLVDSLKCKGFVNGSTAIDTRTEVQKNQHGLKNNFMNLKTQCYFKLRDFVNNNTINLEKLEQYKQEIIEELDVVAEIDIDKDNKKKIVSKEDVKMAIGRSPDFADCIMFRMFFELKHVEKIDAEFELNMDMEYAGYLS